MSRSRLAHRGMTLMEVLVYCMLLSLFSILLFVNLPTRDSASSEDLRQAVARADNALELLTQELSNSSDTSVTAITSPPGVIFLTGSARSETSFTYTADGQIAWIGWIGYFLVDKALVRVYYPLPSGGVARSSVTATPTYATMIATGTRNPVCADVEAFSVTIPEANLWQFDLRMNLRGNITTVTSGAGARN